jgi:hypothetical protein
MATAARTPLRIAYSQAQAALEEANVGPQPMEPTADEQEAARSYLADMTVALPEAPAMVQCDGYSRPYFGNDDVGFWLWAIEFQAKGGLLDDGDRNLFDELATSPAFAQQLSNRRSIKE